MTTVTTAAELEVKRARTFDGSNNVIGDQPYLTFNSNFKEAYVQTRHKNLRCFPVCCPVHMEKSFCGRIVEVTVRKDIDLQNSLFFGEFRSTSAKPTFSPGDIVTSDAVIDSDEFVLGEYIFSNGDGHRFIVNPSRKWFYPRTASVSELHTFTVYFSKDGKVLHTIDSPQFKVQPVWKDERKPSSGGSVSGSKAKSQTSIPATATPSPVFPQRTLASAVSPAIKQADIERPTIARAVSNTPATSSSSSSPSHISRDLPRSVVQPAQGGPMKPPSLPQSLSGIHSSNIFRPLSVPSQFRAFPHTPQPTLEMPNMSTPYSLNGFNSTIAGDHMHMFRIPPPPSSGFNQVVLGQMFPQQHASFVPFQPISALPRIPHNRHTNVSWEEKCNDPNFMNSADAGPKRS